MCELKQYEISFPSEFTRDILKDLATTMNIEFDTERLENSLKNNGKNSEDGICIFKDFSDPRCFILLDCLNIDIFYTVVARCKSENHEEVKKVLLGWDRKGRRAYHQSAIPDHLEDTLLEEDTMFNEIVRMYSLNI